MPSIIPKAGNATSGTNAVTDKGKASVTHQVAINKATAAVLVISGFPGSRLPKSNNISEMIRPVIRPILFLSNLIFSIIMKGLVNQNANST